MRRARLCPKTCRARIRRDGRCRVNRLRHVVNRIPIHQPRGRGSHSDIDLRRVVDIPRRCIRIAVDARLVARRDGQCTLLDCERANRRGDIVVRRNAAAAGRKCHAVECHRIRADACALGHGVAAAVDRRDRVLCEAVPRGKRARIRRRGNCHTVIRRTVDALAARRGEVNVDGLDGQFARHIFELVVVCRKRAVLQVNTVLARMDSALRISRRLRRIRNRGIGNRTREQSRCCRRLAVREIRECDARVARVAVRRAVVVDRLRLARDRNDTRHDAVVDRDLVVEVVVSYISNLLIGDGRIRAVGMRTRTHIDIGQRIRHCAVRRIDVGIDICQLRRAEVMRARILHMVADIVDLRLVERTTLEVAVVFDMEARRRVEEGRVVIAVGTRRVELEFGLVLVEHGVLACRNGEGAAIRIVHAIFTELEYKPVDLVLDGVLRMHDIALTGRGLDGVRAALVLECAALRLDEDIGRARADDLPAGRNRDVAAVLVRDIDGGIVSLDNPRDICAALRLDGNARP